MNSLYLSGQEYAGIYAPYLLHRIHTYNKAHMNDANSLKLNLKGMIIFNGLTDPLFDQQVAMIEVLNNHNLISDVLYDQIAEN